MKVKMNTALLFLIISLFACKQKDSSDPGISETILESEISVADEQVEDTFPIIDAPIANPVEKDNLQSEKKQILDDEITIDKEVVETIEHKEEDNIDVGTEENIELIKEIPVEKDAINQVQSQKEVAPDDEVLLIEDVTVPDHNLFDILLKEYVSNDGNVNYSGLKKVEGKLEEYLNNLSSHPVEDSWTKNEKLAYWINAYNAFTIKLILKNYPVKSIMDINNGKAWDLKWIKLGSKTYSLNQIENDIIRPQFKEPRIHFAVNCAAESCPPISNRAYTASNLESMLEKNAKNFITNSKYNSISEKNIEVSRIFDWYGADFGNLIDYLNKYAETSIKSSAKVKFKEYDWSLNGK